jgi:1,4-alpha-glucan branching enzyme
MAKANKTAEEQSFAIRAPGATRVQLVGDFTHWQKLPINMRKGADGVWRSQVPLEPGTHHYRFLIDGEWTDDPDCTLRVSNEFGSENMVRKVA